MKRIISVVSFEGSGLFLAGFILAWNLAFMLASSIKSAEAQKPRKIPQAEVQAYLEQELIKADDRAQRDHETIAVKEETIAALQRQLDDLRKKIRTAQNALR